jgi:UV DNA damage endonuclease
VKIILDNLIQTSYNNNTNNGDNMKLGYACINKTLSEQPKSKRVTTNRTFRKATFEEKGLAHASAIFLQNARDLLTILQWNEKHNIKFFRLSSQIVSWATEYQLCDLPDYSKIEEVLFNCGLFIEENGMRITTHPDHFVKLASSTHTLCKDQHTCRCFIW